MLRVPRALRSGFPGVLLRGTMSAAEEGEHGGTMAKKGLLSRKSRAGDWFRVGVFSATVIAPLLARWNDLRMAERAQQLGKGLSTMADEQTRDLRQLAVEQVRELSELAA